MSDTANRVDVHTLPVLSSFRFRHLPPHLRVVSEPFAGLALKLCELLPASADRTLALRELVRAKDAAVRAAIPPDPSFSAEELASDAHAAPLRAGRPDLRGEVDHHGNPVSGQQDR